MSLIKYFYERNKLLAIGIISLIISTLTLIVINVCVNNLLLKSNTLVLITIGGFSHLLAILTGIGALVLITIVCVINNIGKIREDLIRYYGKDKYLKYLYGLNIVSIILAYMLMVTLLMYNLYYISVTYYGLLESMKDPQQLEQMIRRAKEAFEHNLILGLVIIIILEGIKVAMINLKELFVNSKYKYSTKKKKVLKFCLRLSKYILLGIFASACSVAYMSLYNQGFNDYVFGDMFLREGIRYWELILMLIMILIIVLIDYKKTFNDEGIL